MRTESVAFCERQKLRVDEVVAVEKAAEILSSGAVPCASEKHLPRLGQLKQDPMAQIEQVT